MEQTQILARQNKGKHIAQTSRITRNEKGWKVPSQSGNGFYLVVSNGIEAKCNCPDHETRHCKCKHIWAVQYDSNRKGMKPKGISKRWTDDEERYVLLHHEEGDTPVGEVLGRSHMSIYMHKSHLLSEFDAWLRGDEGKSYKDSSREEQVNAFMNYEPEED